MFVFLEELYYSWRMLHFQNLRKKFLQHPDQIPLLQSLGWSATKRDGQTSSEKTVYVNQTGIFSFFQNQPKCWMEQAKYMERVEAGKSHIGSGVANHPLEIYTALSAAFMPIA